MCNVQHGCRCLDGQQHVPGECSAEQIEQCHGTAGDHPCLSGSEDAVADCPDEETK